MCFATTVDFVSRFRHVPRLEEYHSSMCRSGARDWAGAGRRSRYFLTRRQQRKEGKTLKPGDHPGRRCRSRSTACANSCSLAVSSALRPTPGPNSDFAGSVGCDGFERILLMKFASFPMHHSRAEPAVRLREVPTGPSSSPRYRSARCRSRADSRRRAGARY